MKREKYLKIGETDTLKNGETIVCVRTPRFRMGCVMCYLSYKRDCDYYECVGAIREDKTDVHFGKVRI